MMDSGSAPLPRLVRNDGEGGAMAAGKPAGRSMRPDNEKGDGDCSPSPRMLRQTGLAARLRSISASRTR